MGKRLVTSLAVIFAIAGAVSCDDEAQRDNTSTLAEAPAGTNPQDQPASRDSLETMEDAYEACNRGYSEEQFRVVADYGAGQASLTIAGFVEGGPGEEEIFCVLDALDAPDEVVNSVVTTEYNNGTEVWDDFKFAWTYDPSQPGQGWQAFVLAGFNPKTS
jgi:hypothetical protein